MICFAAHSLEPSFALGDVVRQYAAEALRRQIKVCLLAVHDPFCSETWRGEIDVGGTLVAGLRLSASVPWEQRVKAAVEFLKAEDAKIISLRFGPYSLQKKGFVGACIEPLAEMFRGRVLQVMVDELWLGVAQEASLKERLLGYFQRRKVLQMFHRLKPQVIHVHAPYAKALLQQYNITANLLPLIGNLPIVQGDEGAWLKAQVAAQGISLNLSNHREYLLIGFFGALYLGPGGIADALRFFKLMTELEKRSQKKVLVISIGRSGEGLNTYLTAAARTNFAKKFIVLGVQPAHDVSLYLQALDFGASTTPWGMIGKSGSTASMREHGLPVLVLRDDQTFSFKINENPNSDEKIFLLNEEILDLITKVAKDPPRRRIEAVFSTFLRDLQSVSL